MYGTLFFTKFTFFKISNSRQFGDKNFFYSAFTWMISGARYSGVPHNVQVRSDTFLAKPKSVILIWPSLFKKGKYFYCSKLDDKVVLRTYPKGGFLASNLCTLWKANASNPRQRLSPNCRTWKCDCWNVQRFVNRKIAHPHTRRERACTGDFCLCETKANQRWKDVWCHSILTFHSSRGQLVWGVSHHA